MQELNVTFTPANGEPPRVITLRIGTPVRGERSWTTRVEILGFDESHAWTPHGEDWAQVLELAAMVLPTALQMMVRGAGGGTLDPPFYEREPRNTPVPPEVRAVLDAPP
jgi:hypothetical protein